jgi:mannose-6-phosphate isomerase class I
MAEIRGIIEKALEKGNGVLNLKPAWVARDFLPPGRRLGLTEKEYNVGARGFICERWLASVTKADNAIGTEDEGLSYLNTGSKEEVTLREAVASEPELIMGKEYSKTHKGLGRLAKIYDFGARIPYHVHQMEKDARLVGANSKDEAYYFPEDVDTGPHPETYFGVHPYIVDEKKYDILLPYLVDWKDDLILQHSRAYLNLPGEGFFLPSGILHAPGTALTIELQEDSDVFAMLQALNAGKIISKDLLFKDVRKEDREKIGEKVILDQLDWPANGDPYFYENHHLANIFIEETKQDGGTEHWVYYNTTKFSGKRLIVKPGQSFTSKEKGVYNILVWKGSGSYDGHKIEAGNFECDELLISHERAIKPLTVKNDGRTDLLIIKFFGPDINLDAPKIKPYKK